MLVSMCQHVSKLSMRVSCGVSHSTCYSYIYFLQTAQSSSHALHIWR